MQTRPDPDSITDDVADRIPIFRPGEVDPALAAGRLAIAVEAAIAAHGARAAARREQRVAAIAESERRRREASAAAIAAHDRTVTSAITLRDETLEREEHRYQERLQRIDRELAEAERTAREKAESSDEQTRKALAEAVWIADSVHESGLERNQKEADGVRERIATARQVLEEQRRESLEFLRRCRQREPRFTLDPEKLAAAIQGPTAVPGALVDLREAAARLQKLTLPLMFRGFIPVLLLLPGVVVGGTAAAFARPGEPVALAIGAGAGIGASLLILAICRLVARRQIRGIYRRFAFAAATVDRAAEVALKDASETRRRGDQVLDRTLEAEKSAAEEKFSPVLEEISGRLSERLAQLETLGPKYREKALASRDERVEEAVAAADAEVKAAERARVEALAHADEAATAAAAAAEEAHQVEGDAIEAKWSAVLADLATSRSSLERLAEPRRLSWTDPAWRSWDPHAAPGLPIMLGESRVDPAALLAAHPPAHPEDAASPLPEAFSLPLLLDLPHRRGLLVEVDGASRPRGLEVLQAAVLRILTTIPPGKVRLVLVDPVGLGQNFAGFMHLADEDQALVGDRIWTDPRHIEQRLTDLTEHMETVIQKYLRNEFDSIDAYNEKAGEIAEPYRVLVMADLPANLTETGGKRLASILESGARCGVLTLLLRDLRMPLPPALLAEDLARNVVRVHPRSKESTDLAVAVEGLAALPLALDQAPPADLLQALAGRIGRSAKTASKVEVPFEAIAPQGSDRWTLDSGQRLAVSLGRAGATRLQQMVLGEGTAQHVLIAGKTGSGKSTLLHALITNLAAWYSPEQVQLYLVDFKKGVEFKTYATHRLPHIKAVAVESDREFGLSVLQGLDAELKRRGDLYRAVGVQDLKGYRAARPDDPMPRTLLVIDEFQELFTEDDKVASEAGLLLDRIARQGRAFGVHAVLGSQTLGGAYSLARSTMGQMGVRIALQCSEADAQVILSDDNSAARLLSRPGEAIYNDAGGLVEGNSPFQVVWLPEEVRDRVLADVVTLAKDRGLPPAMPLIFEGSAPADLASNAPLAELLRDHSKRPSRELLRIWVGDPVAIRDPACAEFRRQPGSNLIVVGQQIETTLGMLASGLIGAAAQREAKALRILLADGTAADDPSAGTLPAIVERLPCATKVLTPRELSEALVELAQEVLARQDDPTRDATTTLLVIHGLHRFRDLRRDEDDYGFSADEGPPKPDKLFASILREGPAVGVHVVASADTVPNLQRVVDRNGLREFDWRVALQMGASDASTLIDSPLASRLGLTRAYLHSEEQGLLEKFRPYPPPPIEFVDRALREMVD